MSVFMLLNRWFGIQLNPHFLGIDLKYVTCFELYHPPFRNNVISLITTSHVMMPKAVYVYWFSILCRNTLIIFTHRWFFPHDFLSLQINISSGDSFLVVLLYILTRMLKFPCRFFFVRAGMMGWLLINLSVLARSVLNATLSQSMILYQTFCAVNW